MKISAFIFAQLVIISYIFPQSYKQDVFTELSINSEVTKVRLNDNESYSLLLNVNGSFQTIELDAAGNKTSNKIFNEFDYKLLSSEFASQNSYLILFTNPSATDNNYSIALIDSNFETKWIKEFSLDNSFTTYPFIMSTSEGDIFTIQYNSADKKIKFIKHNSSGEVKWQKEFENNIGFTVNYSVTELPGNFLLLNTRKNIIKINYEGDVQWIFDNSNNIYCTSYNAEGEIFCGTNDKIIKLNSNGEKLDEFFLPSTMPPLTIKIFNDNSILVFQRNFMFVLNSSGELKIEKIINFSIKSIDTKGNRFIAGGSTNSSASIIICDINNIPSKFLTLLSPVDGRSYPIEYRNGFPIEWISDNIDSIKVDFSSDGGLSWKELNGNTPNYSKNIFYVHEIPIINSNNCLIKISDFYAPDISDQNGKPFSLRPYKYYESISANECFMWIGNNGMSEHDPFDDDSGFYWPGGSNESTSTSFAAGVVWGGKINGNINFNGTTYRYGLIPGAILENGDRDDPTKVEYSLFKLKKNWENLPEGYEKDLMRHNYNNWPAQHGAPYHDVDGDGKFNRDIDKPEIIGDETLFYVANDLDSLRTNFTYGCNPIGIEFQQTVFAYNTPELKDAVFKKVKIINKGLNHIEDMYLGYWVDDDLGNANDDFVGCDSSLSLAFTWNGDNFDEDNYGEAPPAIGRIILQGPTVYSKYDTAIVDGKTIPERKNLQMTSFFPLLKFGLWQDSNLGVYSGAIQFYNNLQGLAWNGEPIIDPVTNDTTKYSLSGDPVNRTGWYEGAGWPNGISPYDRRHLMSSGSFSMAPGDTQVVVYAIFMARGTDHVSSVAELKKTAIRLHEFWGNEIPTKVKRVDNQIPENYSLSQNYPNPFNPTTTIEYTIPHSESGSKNTEFVSLIVYDILGREVGTLVNEKQKPGKYWVEWDASKHSTGIYFYRISIGNYVRSKKMLLLK
ncbi:MAG: hypothetical protein CVV23_16600 [Ignavibacteriae bacterium HGW-Ignavibacteriae-2]|nr:MAG: hypothetical protein CVV23_16600 [Ignavibacteriae bacterium HGW-Ignavibacteriae-2]